ncbi:SHOCT domain-containing protein [Ornithinimicrobium cryptoxanthini]|uniref:SHOCT domain-containing protein n=1 Tax=Ornithinimicrobium cryptoxanthini TaxID=2934161 RepID=A0ABY4YMA1_9MICO|nr:SHOCT domain-containing protein [Ornithinimicrobium cryptoxanthini]USQ77851.1 SHOCT domain-containing protein [Ornithinimicrobium cryptoxanthini]
MSLLRTAARTAVITSTATRVHQRASRRQSGQWAEQHQQPVAPAAPEPPPAAAPAAPTPAPAQDTATMIAQLTQLGELKAAGVLTDAEFEVQKARVLHGG